MSSTSKMMFGFCDACSRSFPATYESCIHCSAKLRLETLASPGTDTTKKNHSRIKHARMLSETLGRDELAKYPFLADAQSHVAKIKPEQMTDDVLAKAVSRLDGAISGYSDYTLADGEDGAIKELLTFVAEVLIVKLAGVDALVRRFALSEARRVEYFMLWDLRGDRSLARSFAKNVLEREFGLMLQEVHAERKQPASSGKKNDNDDSDKKKNEKKRKDESGWGTLLAIPVVDYLLHVTTLRSKEWSLKERMVEGGMVFLRDKEVARLIRHQLQVRLILRIRAMPMPEKGTIPENLSMAAEQVKAKHKAKFEQGVMVLPAVLPPCIRKIIEMMEHHENVSHAGRILLATYMVANGRPADEICSLFKGAPDYNEQTTRKNIAYLAGQNAQSRAYHVKGCERVKADGFCFADAGCTNITHPLQYGRGREHKHG